MALKIALSAGHGPNTPGKRGPNGFREHSFTYPTAEYVAKYLGEYENVSIKKVYSKTADIPLEDRTDAANSWGADIYVSIHGNASGTGEYWDSGHGIETFVYSLSTSNEGYKVARKVQDKLIAATKLANRGVKANPGLWEMKATKMPAFLVEGGFYTNKAENALMRTAAYQQKVARAIVDALADHYNLKKKVVEKEPVSGKLYRVQVGAFRGLTNAQNLLRAVKAAGYKDAYIRTTGGLNRIQVGAFSEYENAEAMVRELKKKGYDDAWITT